MALSSSRRGDSGRRLLSMTSREDEGERHREGKAVEARVDLPPHTRISAVNLAGGWGLLSSAGELSPWFPSAGGKADVKANGDESNSSPSEPGSSAEEVSSPSGDLRLRYRGQPQAATSRTKEQQQAAWLPPESGDEDQTGSSLSLWHPHRPSSLRRGSSLIQHERDHDAHLRRHATSSHPVEVSRSGSSMRSTVPISGTDDDDAGFGIMRPSASDTSLGSIMAPFSGRTANWADSGKRTRPLSDGQGKLPAGPAAGLATAAVGDAAGCGSGGELSLRHALDCHHLMAAIAASSDAALASSAVSLESIVAARATALPSGSRLRSAQDPTHGPASSGGAAAAFVADVDEESAAASQGFGSCPSSEDESPPLTRSNTSRSQGGSMAFLECFPVMGGGDRGAGGSSSSDAARSQQMRRKPPEMPLPGSDESFGWGNQRRGNSRDAADLEDAADGSGLDNSWRPLSPADLAATSAPGADVAHHRVARISSTSSSGNGSPFSTSSSATVTERRGGGGSKWSVASKVKKMLNRAGSSLVMKRSISLSRTRGSNPGDERGAKESVGKVPEPKPLVDSEGSKDRVVRHSQGLHTHGSAGIDEDRSYRDRKTTRVDFAEPEVEDLKPKQRRCPRRSGSGKARSQGAQGTWLQEEANTLPHLQQRVMLSRRSTPSPGALPSPTTTNTFSIAASSFSTAAQTSPEQSLGARTPSPRNLPAGAFPWMSGEGSASEGHAASSAGRAAGVLETTGASSSGGRRGRRRGGRAKGETVAPPQEGEASCGPTPGGWDEEIRMRGRGEKQRGKRDLKKCKSESRIVENEIDLRRPLPRPGSAGRRRGKSDAVPEDGEGVRARRNAFSKERMEEGSELTETTSWQHLAERMSTVRVDLDVLRRKQLRKEEVLLSLAAGEGSRDTSLKSPRGNSKPKPFQVPPQAFARSEAYLDALAEALGTNLAAVGLSSIASIGDLGGSNLRLLIQARSRGGRVRPDSEEQAGGEVTHNVCNLAEDSDDGGSRKGLKEEEEEACLGKDEDFVDGMEASTESPVGAVVVSRWRHGQKKWTGHQGVTAGRIQKQPETYRRVSFQDQKDAEARNLQEAEVVMPNESMDSAFGHKSEAGETKEAEEALDAEERAEQQFSAYLSRHGNASRRWGDWRRSSPSASPSSGRQHRLQRTSRGYRVLPARGLSLKRTSSRGGQASRRQSKSSSRASDAQVVPLADVALPAQLGTDAGEGHKYREPGTMRLVALPAQLGAYAGEGHMYREPGTMRLGRIHEHQKRASRVAALDKYHGLEHGVWGGSRMQDLATHVPCMPMIGGQAESGSTALLPETYSVDPHPSPGVPLGSQQHRGGGLSLIHEDRVLSRHATPAWNGRRSLDSSNNLSTSTRVRFGDCDSLSHRNDVPANSFPARPALLSTPSLDSSRFLGPVSPDLLDLRRGGPRLDASLDYQESSQVFLQRSPSLRRSPQTRSLQRKSSSARADDASPPALSQYKQLIICFWSVLVGLCVLGGAVFVGFLMLHPSGRDSRLNYGAHVSVVLGSMLFAMAVVSSCLWAMWQLTDRLEARMAMLLGDLSVARSAQEGAVKAKNEFLGSVSHEIRTPLNGIIGMLHMMSENDDADEDIREAIEVATQSCWSLNDWVAKFVYSELGIATAMAAGTHVPSSSVRSIRKIHTLARKSLSSSGGSVKVPGSGSGTWSGKLSSSGSGSGVVSSWVAGRSGRVSGSSKARELKRPSGSGNWHSSKSSHTHRKIPSNEARNDTRKSGEVHEGASPADSGRGIKAQLRKSVREDGGPNVATNAAASDAGEASDFREVFGPANVIPDVGRNDPSAMTASQADVIPSSTLRLAVSQGPTEGKAAPDGVLVTVQEPSGHAAGREANGLALDDAQAGQSGGTERLEGEPKPGVRLGSAPTISSSPEGMQEAPREASRDLNCGSGPDNAGPASGQDMNSSEGAEEMSRSGNNESSGKSQDLIAKASLSSNEPAEPGTSSVRPAAAAFAKSDLAKDSSCNLRRTRSEIGSSLKPLVAAGAQEEPASKPEFRPINIKGCKVLVVDDNAVNRKVLVAKLKPFGAEVVQAIHGQQAVDLMTPIDAHDFVCVFMDLQMPVMDGYEATREIRRLEMEHSNNGVPDDSAGLHIPIFAITADVVAGVKQKCLDAGMDEYLTKPLSKERLLDALALIPQKG